MWSVFARVPLPCLVADINNAAQGWRAHHEVSQALRADDQDGRLLDARYLYLQLGNITDCCALLADSCSGPSPLWKLLPSVLL